MIKRKIAKTVVVGIAASAAIGLTATAFATVPTFKITAGTKTSGSIAYTGKATGTTAKPAIHLNDGATHTTCVSGTASGSIKLGAHISGTKAATITKTTWTKCTGPFGITLTPKQVGTWSLNGAARPVNGVTKVFIGNVVANVGTSLPGCKFTVKGAADGTYTNSTGKLTLKPRTGSGHVLKASNVGSCAGQINNGDKLTFTGTYLISTSAGKIKIS